MVYNTYRDKIFNEGNKVAWDFVNDGTAKHETDILRLSVFSP